MNQKANTFLETERIGKLMAKYAVPCVISLLVAALYNIVDQIFIANCRLSWFLRNAPIRWSSLDCGGLVYRSDDWRRLLCLLSAQPGSRRQGYLPQEHRQRGTAVYRIQPSFDGSLSGIPRADFDPVRRASQRRNLSPRQGILFLDYPGHTVLYVWAGAQSHYPLRRQSPSSQWPPPWPVRSSTSYWIPFLFLCSVGA